jgi:coenzyme PQQ precursor peptide PqqA
MFFQDYDFNTMNANSGACLAILLFSGIDPEPWPPQTAQAGGSYFGAVDAPRGSTILPDALDAPKDRRAGSPSPGKEMTMNTLSWTTPQACEICVGMEVTAYMSAEI